MGLLQHLEELRRRIINSFLSIIVVAGICLWWQKDIYNWVMQPVMQALRDNHLPEKLAYTNPTEPFNTFMKMAMIAGVFIASPIVLYQVWAFIRPALYKSERRYVIPFMISTVGLFLGGGYFGYKMVYPSALNFLIGYADPTHYVSMITLSEYTNLFLTIILGLGLVFEMPILVFFLSFFGIVSAKWMLRNMRYAILGIFVVAAILSPTPDVTNMCLFALPMLGLYLVSVLIAWIFHPAQRKNRKKAQGA